MKHPVMLEERLLERLLLEYRKNLAIRRLARGGAHAYNNIFAGLGGQIGMALKGGEQRSVPKGELINELLQRGIVQTELLHDFCLERKDGKRSCSAGRIGQRAVALLNTISRDHVFELERQPSLPRLSCNFQDMVLMLFYLGENAMEATTGRQKIILEVQACRYEQKDGIRFSLADEGSGIDPAIRPDLFTPFCTTKEHELAGLGLYSVRRIVAEHGGSFTLSARDQGGTVAMVDLPALPVDHGVPETEKRRKKRISKPVKHVFLVVDDEEGMRRMLFERLRRRGHTVFCVNTCSEAVQEFTRLQDTITCVLLDLRLEDAAGVQCADQLRGISPDIFLVFMSGIESNEDLERYASSPFLRKPFSIDQLEEVIANGNA